MHFFVYHQALVDTDLLSLKYVQFRYMLLKSVNTEAGRGRAWLRASLNEHSLERYVHLFLSDQQILEQHYEPSAFIRDEVNIKYVVQCIGQQS